MKFTNYASLRLKTGFRQISDLAESTFDYSYFF